MELEAVTAVELESSDIIKLLLSAIDIISLLLFSSRLSSSWTEQGSMMEKFDTELVLFLIFDV